MFKNNDSYLFSRKKLEDTPLNEILLNLEENYYDYIATSRVYKCTNKKLKEYIAQSLKENSDEYPENYIEIHKQLFFNDLQYHVMLNNGIQKIEFNDFRSIVDKGGGDVNDQEADLLYNRYTHLLLKFKHEIKEKDFISKVSPKNSLIRYCKIMFENELNKKFHISPYILEVVAMLEKVFIGKIKRLMINIPPRHCKTELAVIHFISWALGNSPRSKFMHVSYTKELANNNIMQIKQKMISNTYKELFPNASILNRANTEIALTLGGAVKGFGGYGSVTGFGCGDSSDNENFMGAMIIDDPIKPREAYSKVIREKVNNNYYQTLLTRVNNRSKTPIIIIMQRTHEDDLCGNLLKKEPDDWTVVKYPAINENGELLDTRSGDKETILKRLRQIEKNDWYVFQSQFQQNPLPIGGLKFKDEWFRYYDRSVNIPFERVIITGDTAFRQGEKNSFSVFQVWGKYENRAYLVDQRRGKWSPKELGDIFMDFYAYHNIYTKKIQKIFIESQAMGIPLIDKLLSQGIPVEAINRKHDKVFRVNMVLPYFQSGLVYIPQMSGDKGWNEMNEYINELKSFSDEGSHEFDDQVDATCDGVEQLLKIESKDQEFNIWGV